MLPKAARGDCTWTCQHEAVQKAYCRCSRRARPSHNLFPGILLSIDTASQLCTVQLIGRRSNVARTSRLKWTGAEKFTLAVPSALIPDAFVARDTIEQPASRTPLIYVTMYKTWRFRPIYCQARRQKAAQLRRSGTANKSDLVTFPRTSVRATMSITFQGTLSEVVMANTARREMSAMPDMLTKRAK